jgi:hypothetical protein
MPEKTALPTFQPITGIPASGLNLVITLLGYLLIVSVFGLGVLFVYSCIFDDFHLLVLIAGIVFVWASLCFMKEIPKDHNTKCSLKVDADGLHDIVAGKVNRTNSILFNDLANSNTNPKQGVILRSNGESYQGIGIFLTEGSAKVLKFTSPSLGLQLGGLYKNKKELVAAFLLGVATFRPDIIIDADVFWFYNIDEATFTPDG